MLGLHIKGFTLMELTIIAALFVVILVIIIKKKKGKKAENGTVVSEDFVLEDVTKNPSAEKVFAFMNYFNNTQGSINNPQNWDKLRGIWFIINGSGNIPTDVKVQFRDWLVFKGFSLGANEMAIIDNCSMPSYNNQYNNRDNNQNNNQYTNKNNNQF